MNTKEKRVKTSLTLESTNSPSKTLRVVVVTIRPAHSPDQHISSTVSSSQSLHNVRSCLFVCKHDPNPSQLAILHSLLAGQSTPASLLTGTQRPVSESHAFEI